VNEQIQAFMNRAGTDTSGKWMGVEHAEKFAELIVRECAQVYWNIDDSELHEEYVKALKKHFGIKK
jgi:hypothetical protein